MFSIGPYGVLPYSTRVVTANYTVSTPTISYLATGRSPARFMTLAVPLTVNYGTDAYTIEFEIAMSDSSESQDLIGHDTTSSIHGIYFTPGGRFQVTINNSQVYFSNVGFGVFDREFHTYRIEHDSGGALRYYRDGVLFQSTTFTSSISTTVPLNTLFRTSSTAYCAIVLFKYLEVTGFGAGSARWEASLANGTGTVLPSVSGTNNATQAGTWPIDNNEWARYSPAVVNSTSTVLKWHNGSIWLIPAIKYHNGTTWVTKPIKRHNGTSWS